MSTAKQDLERQIEALLEAGIGRERIYVDKKSGATVDLICEQWEDILRVAGSLSTGTVRASELLRVLQGRRTTEPPRARDRRVPLS